MNEEEKKAVEKFRKLGVKKFREEKIKNEDLLSYIEYVVILNLIEKLQKENELAKQALIKNSNIADERNQLLNEYQKLKKYIAMAPNLDEMTATKYRNIQQEAYIQGRAEEQRKAEQIIYENYISKQKIKDIVRELEENIFRIKKHYSNGGENCSTSYLENLAQIKILKQILKESEEK